MSDVPIEFEHWLRFTMPKKLCLSEPKKAAIDSILYHFSDSVRSLERKAPDEFKAFFGDLKSAIDRAAKKRKPFGHFIYEGRYRELPKEELRLLKRERERARKRRKRQS